MNFPVELKLLTPYSKEENHLFMSNDIKILLDIQDENIYFENNYTENKEFKGKTSKFITGTLTYQPSCCENCGVKK